MGGFGWTVGRTEIHLYQISLPAFKTQMKQLLYVCSRFYPLFPLISLLKVFENCSFFVSILRLRISMCYSLFHFVSYFLFILQKNTFNFLCETLYSPINTDYSSFVNIKTWPPEICSLQISFIVSIYNTTKTIKHLKQTMEYFKMY